FLEFLPVTKGILAGTKMKLLPDQVEFITQIYGRRKPDGRREVSLAIKSAPKGNGKTGLTAGLALCHLIGPEAEERGEIYSASIDKIHAGKMYAEMEAIIFRVPEFASRINPQRFHKRLEVIVEGDGYGSIYEALSADARKAQGLAPSLWIYDELAQVSDRELLDNLLEGMSKRKEALGIIISTQAKDDLHPLSQLIDEGLKHEDPTTFVHLIAAEPDADPFDIEVLKSVNPAWGAYLDLDDLMKSRNRAMKLKAFEGAYRNLRLNQRVDANDQHRIVTAAVWKLGAVPVKVADGAVCYGGLDLSGKHDLSSLVLSFPDNAGGFDLLPFFWTPEGQLAGRQPREQQLFRQWIDEGHMIAVPGPVIEFEYVAAQIAAIARRYKLLTIAYDRWRIDEFKHELTKIGATVEMEPFGQGYKEMSPAVEHFAELALTARLRHGGHPVLNACVANAILTPADDAGNQKFMKGKANREAPVRIDGVVAAAMSLGVAKRKMAVAPLPLLTSEQIVARAEFIL
ncbi:MAG: terminase large subunit, partial [Anaerolineaceae bacterium]